VVASWWRTVAVLLALVLVVILFRAVSFQLSCWTKGGQVETAYFRPKPLPDLEIQLQMCQKGRETIDSRVGS
jgi:hypothetical protein